MRPRAGAWWSVRLCWKGVDMGKMAVLVIVGMMLAGAGWVWAAEAATQAGVSSKAVEKDGMSAVLTVGKTTFGVEEGPSFAVQYKNVSKKPLAVFDLEWYWNWKTCFEDEAKGGPWRVRPLIMFKRAAIVPRVLQPGETVEVAVDLGRDPAAQEYEWAGKQEKEVAPVKRLGAGKYRLSVEVKLQEGDPVAGAAYWKGPIKTDPVEITMAAAGSATTTPGAQAAPAGGNEVATSAAKFAENAGRKWGAPTGVSAHEGEFWVTFETPARERALSGPRTVIVNSATGTCRFQKRD